MTEIFVFGSNLAGRHGKGSALYAKMHYGAIQGKGIGHAGNSYAIPTKDENLKVLKPSAIRHSIQDFIEYAKQHPELSFHIVDIGCGLAGYRPDFIALMFLDAPANCHFLGEFGGILGRTQK